MPNNANDNSILDDLNMGCVDCLPVSKPDVECDTTEFTTRDFTNASATVIPIEHDDYSVCCDPIAIKPIDFILCTRGAVRLIEYKLTTIPSEGKLMLGDEELVLNSTFGEQENGMLTYVRTIVPGEEPCDPQEAGEDTFEITIITSGGNSDPLEIKLILNEAVCCEEKLCDDCKDCN